MVAAPPGRTPGHLLSGHGGSVDAKGSIAGQATRTACAFSARPSAPESVARLWERDAADPDAAKLRDATLGDALRLLLTDREERANAGRASHYTVSFYAVKTGHLTRIFEHDERGTSVPFPLAKLKAYDVDRYISKRRAEGASESTISKELIALRASLKLARRAGIWRGDPQRSVRSRSRRSTNRGAAF